MPPGFLNARIPNLHDDKPRRKKARPYSRWTSEQVRLREALIELFVAQEFPYFLTLNFNREMTPDGAKRVLKVLLAFIDRHFLGPRWQEMPVHRTQMIAIPENITTNFHYHAGAGFPPKAMRLSPVDVEKIIQRNFGRLVPGATCKLLVVEDAAGLADYITKQQWQPDAIERVVLSREFWPS